MRRLHLIALLLFALLLPLVAACGIPPADEAAEEEAEEEAEEAEEEAEEAEEEAEEAEEDTDEMVTEEDSDISVGLVTDIGRVNDGTFNEFAHEGAMQAADDFGLEYDYLETQSQADYDQNVETMVDEGYDVIVTVGFLIADATFAAAEENPDHTFIGVDQSFTDDRALPNLIGIQFREDQGGFLVGALAGMMTESDTIGFVGGIDVPAVKKFRNGYIHGARYVNPDVEVFDVYVPSFTDPAQGASIAEQFIGDGADIIFGAGGATGSGAISAAAEAEQEVYVIGVDQDEYETTFGGGEAPGSDKILTSAIKRVDIGVYNQIEAVVEDSFEGGSDYILNVSNDGVGYADFHETEDEIPEEVQERLEEIREMLAEGDLTTGVEPLSGEVEEDTIPEPEPFEPEE